MSTLLALLAILGPIGSVFGQQQASIESCLVACTNVNYQKAPQGMDMGKILNVQVIKIGNTTATCPQMSKNQRDQMDTTCGLLKELKTCTDACPDTPIKQLTMSAFKTQQFICIDRMDDIKKYMPCLSQTCPTMQQHCNPQCGSIEASTQRIVDLIHRVQGGGARPPASAPPGANGTSNGPIQDVDMNTITKAIADTCRTISCFMTCGEAQVTKQCGKDAYLLQRDFTWTMFSSVAQSMSSIGIQTQWPDECRALASAGNGTVGPPGPAPSNTVNPVTGTPKPSRNDNGTSGTPPPATATVPILLNATVPHVIVNGTVPVQAGTTPVPPGDTKVAKANGTAADESKKCDKPPCGASTTLIPSILLILANLVMVFRAI